MLLNSPFYISLPVFTVISMDTDLGEELFLMQNMFRSNSNFYTQSAGEAVDFLMTNFDQI